MASKINYIHQDPDEDPHQLHEHQDDDDLTLGGEHRYEFSSTRLNVDHVQ